MIVTLLTEHHLEFLSIKGGCTGSSESILVKIPHCWKSLVQLKCKSRIHTEADECFFRNRKKTCSLDKSKPI